MLQKIKEQTAVKYYTKLPMWAKIAAPLAVVGIGFFLYGLLKNVFFFGLLVLLAFGGAKLYTTVQKWKRDD